MSSVQIACIRVISSVSEWIAFYRVASFFRIFSDKHAHPVCVLLNIFFSVCLVVSTVHPKNNAHKATAKQASGVCVRVLTRG